MDTLNQTAPNVDNNIQNQAPVNSEFATKGPLLTPKLKKRILIGCGAIVALIIGIMIAVFVYQQLNKPLELTPAPPKPVAIDPEPVLSETARFAYVKNGKNIWISNINGEEKFSILELPLTSQSTITSLTWKDKDNLGYSTCDNNSRVCEISSYNFTTKSIKPEKTTTGSMITGFAWSSDGKYLAYMENREGKINLRMKLGTIDTILRSFSAGDDPSLTKTFVKFNADSQYIMYSAPERSLAGSATQSIYIYQLNGAQIDQVSNVAYPFFIDVDTIAYKLNNRLVYKDIGTNEESAITDFTGYNPALSTNEKQIAYWRDEVGFNNVVLGVFESDKGIHRNILRGVILPVWVSDDKIVGIKADSCIGERCLLYEYQTTSLVIVDVNNGEVISIDQGKNLSGVAFYAD